MGGSGGPRGYDNSADRQNKSTGKSKGGGGGGSGDDCDISFEVDLTGVKPEALKTISVGAELDVTIVPSGAYEAVVCQVPKAGGIVGTLAAFSRLAALIACIKQNNKYIATVTLIERGRCTVHVRRT